RRHRVDPVHGRRISAGLAGHPPAPGAARLRPHDPGSRTGRRPRLAPDLPRLRRGPGRGGAARGLGRREPRRDEGAGAGRAGSAIRGGSHPRGRHLSAVAHARPRQHRARLPDGQLGLADRFMESPATRHHEWVFWGLALVLWGMASASAGTRPYALAVVGARLPADFGRDFVASSTRLANGTVYDPREDLARWHHALLGLTEGGIASPFYAHTP